MNLHRLLKERESRGTPLRVGLIGAGKFGSMYLSQVRHTPGMRVTAIADLDPARAREALRRVGWPDGAISSLSFFSDARALIEKRDIDIVIDSTGSPSAGITHVLACCEHRKHIVMVNVEADALAGPLLAQRAREAGIVYSLAYGDQPALICELVDWARACGFEVIAAGKGHEVSACVSRIHARYGVGLLRPDRRRCAHRRIESRRCSTRFWTAPKALSKCARCRTRPD